jgi:hypothetical protein
MSLSRTYIEKEILKAIKIEMKIYKKDLTDLKRFVKKLFKEE